MFAMTLMLIDPPSPLDDPTLCPATRCSSRRCSRPPSKPLLGSCAIRCEPTFALPFSTHALDIAMTATISRKAVALAMADGLCHQTSGDGLAVAVPARLLTTEHEGPCPMAATRLSAQRLKRGERSATRWSSAGWRARSCARSMRRPLNRRTVALISMLST